MAPQYPSAPEGNQYQSAPQNGLGTAALVMGILQFVCLGPIGSVLAVIFGKMGMNKAEQGLATNGDLAKWGFWLGIIGLILAAIGFVVWVMILVLAIATDNSAMGALAQ